MDGIIANLVSSLIWAVLGALGILIARWIAGVFPRKRLWGIDNPNNVVICVSTSTKTNTGVYLRPATGVGQLRALAFLLPSLHRAYRDVRLDNIYLSEDQLSSRIECDLILLGGPENNKITRKFLDKIRPLNYIDQESHIIQWLEPGAPVQFQAVVKDGAVIKDYGLIIRMQNPFTASNRGICLFCGTHTYGTIAAAKFFVEDWYKQHRFTLSLKPNVAMVISCDVIDGHPVGLCLERVKQF